MTPYVVEILAILLLLT